MAIFEFAPTAPGQVLFADVQAGAVLVPTKFVIGTGSLPSGKKPGDMTGVVTPIKDLAVTKKMRTPNGICIFGCVFTNEDITEDFYLREFALYAKAEYRDGNGAVTKTVPEVCFIYGNAGTTADLYPAYSTGTAVERSLEIASRIGDTAQVDMTIDSGALIPQSEKGQPGGVAALDASGNLNMNGKKVSGLATPTASGDAAPKSYVDLMLPLSGGMMTGPINMNGQRVSGLADPSDKGGAVPKGYADRMYGGAVNILINSDFTNPVNRQGLTSYAVNGETIDRWRSISESLKVTIADGYVQLYNEYESQNYIVQDIGKGAIKAGKVYTAAFWLANGSVSAQTITPVSGSDVASSNPYDGLKFVISMGVYVDQIMLYIDPLKKADIKYMALYEGQYTAATLPEYRPIGYIKEQVLCMFSGGIFLRKDKDYGKSLPLSGTEGQLFFLEEG